MVSLPAWFLEPPVLGAASPDDTVVEATTTAQYNQYKSYGYPGPYSTQAAAQAAANSINSNQNTNEKLNDPNGLVTNAASDLTGLSEIGSFFGALSQGKTWLRVGEFVAGGILLYIGLKTAFQNTAVGNVARTGTQTAKKAASKAASVTPVGKTAKTASKTVKRAKKVTNG